MAMSGAWLSTTRTTRLAPLPCRGAHGLLCQVDTSAVDTCLRDLVSTFQRTFDRIAQVTRTARKVGWWMGYQLIAYFPPAVAHTAVSFFSHSLDSHAQEDPQEPPLERQPTGDRESGACRSEEARRAAPLKGV